MSATLPDVAVQFTIGGLQGVKQAFADFDRLLSRLDRTEALHARAGADERVKAEQGATTRIEKTRRGLERDQERAAAQQVRQAEQASRMALRIAEREAKNKERIRQREAKDQERTAATATRMVEKAAKDQERIQERAARDQERRDQAIARHHEAVVRNSLRSEQTLRMQMERATSSAIEREHRRRERFARATGGIVGGGVSRGLGLAGRVAGIAAGVMGGLSVANAMETGIQEQAMAGELVRGSVKTGGYGRENVVGEARGKAIELGMQTPDILGGIGAFTRKTGDLTAMMGMLDEMAKLAAATGSAFEDMGSTGAEVFTQLNRIGQGDRTMEVMRSFAGMGRAGAIDIKDLGMYGSRLAASAGMYQGDLVDTMTSLGAAAQLAKAQGGATDAAEATMAVQHLGSDVSRSEAKEHLAKYGINVWADKGQTKLIGPEQIIIDAVSKTKGNLPALRDIFGERSIRAVQGAQEAYVEAGGGDAGVRAIRRQFQDLRSTTLSKEDVDKNVADAMTEPLRKVTAATEQYHKALDDKLLPLMPKLIESFTNAIPAIAKFAEFIADHANWSGVGMAVGASISFEIAKAGIGALAGKALEKAVLALFGAFKLPVPTPEAPPVPNPLSGPAASAAGGGALRTVAGLAAGTLLPVAAGVGAGAAGKAYLEGKGASAVELAKVWIQDAQQPIADQGGMDHARQILVKLQEAKAQAEGAQKFARAAAFAPAAAMVTTKAAEGDALIRILPQLTQAIEQATHKLNEFGDAAGKIASATDGRGDGMASPNAPERGPIQIGR